MNACPQPSKVRYPDQSAAVAALERVRKVKPWTVPNFAPYPCGTHWHLGHHQGGMKAARRKRKGRR